MTAWIVAVVLLALTAVGAPAARAQAPVQPRCPVGTVKTGEVKTQQGDTIVVQARCRRMTDAELVNEFTRVDALVKGDRERLDAFRSKHLPQVQGQIEEWEQLAEHQKQEVYLTALDAALLWGVSRHAATLNANRELLKGEADWIRSVLAGPKQLEIRQADLRRVLRQLGEARRAGDVMHAIERFQALPTHVVGAAKADRSYEAVAQVLIGGIHALTADPTLHLMATGTEMVAALLWELKVVAVARERVEQLSTVAEGQLKAIAAVTKVYKARVDERAELRRVAASRGIQLPR
jgi:hypothetical protein